MAIRFFEGNKTFLINTLNSSYAFCVNEDKSVTNLYWGARVDNEFDLPVVSQIK